MLKCVRKNDFRVLFIMLLSKFDYECVCSNPFTVFHFVIVSINKSFFKKLLKRKRVLV